ncbi:MAG: phosphate acyltransferase PlsX [Lentisphaerae bacterium]|jgi:glycerol-3-phosphate acyltransferase PlsX|nr:phosphate acyltransferase PlsX [Lentisphaerota bacterium]
MRIAVDAMGGDHAPHDIVRGAVEASRDNHEDFEIILVGDETAIKAELERNKASTSPRLRIVHTTQVIEMNEPPAQAVRSKRDSSIYRGMELVKKGEADAFLSAGSTGAMVAAAIIILRRAPGVKRPAIGTLFPTIGRPVLVIDAGANIDSDEVELEQFAVMGKIYSESIIGQKDPVVGLLSIGGEDLKGNDVTKKTLERLRINPFFKFRGNVEGHDLFQGETDVVVCDGFVGNVLLKSVESAARAVTHWMKQEFTANFIRLLGVFCLRGALKTMRRRMDPELYGGAPLLGVNGTVIITHGGSSHKAIYHAIRVAGEAVKNRVTQKIEEDLAALHQAKNLQEQTTDDKVTQDDKPDLTK